MPRPRGTGSLYLQKDSAVWWIKYHRNGRSNQRPNLLGRHAHGVPYKLPYGNI
jgi:hypothetical protein